MDDGAAVLIEDRVVLILAAEREADLAAFAHAMMMRRAEIPAARPLQQIAANRRHVPDLRTGQLPSSFGQCIVASTHEWMPGELRERNHRPDAQGSARLFDDAPQFGNAAQIDEAARTEQPFFHQVEQVDAASLQDDGIGSRLAALREHGIGNRAGSCACCGGKVAGAGPFETVHVRGLVAGIRPSAPRIVAGVIGNWRTRTPIALYTALAIAGAVAMFDGSAMP